MLIQFGKENFGLNFEHCQIENLTGFRAKLKTFPEGVFLLSILNRENKNHQAGAWFTMTDFLVCLAACAVPMPRSHYSGFCCGRPTALSFFS